MRCHSRGSVAILSNRRQRVAPKIDVLRTRLEKVIFSTAQVAERAVETTRDGKTVAAAHSTMPLPDLVRVITRSMELISERRHAKRYTACRRRGRMVLRIDMIRQPAAHEGGSRWGAELVGVIACWDGGEVGGVGEGRETWGRQREGPDTHSLTRRHR